MTRKRQVSTLKQLCVREVIKNITKYTTSELHCLPINIIEDIIRFPKDVDDEELVQPLSEKSNDTDKIRLIRPNVTYLYLKFDSELISQWPAIQHSNLLNAVLKTSNSLTHFTCNATISWTHQDILNFAVNIPNIVILKITGKNSVDDCILEAIGNNCPKLESLTLKYSKITDEGIRRFCQSKSRGSKLNYLKLDKQSQVTVDGCIIALQSLKELNEFEYDKVIDAFMKLYQELKVGEKYPTFQLCALPLRIEMERQTKKGFLNFITKCCPNLSELELDTSENFENDIIEYRKCNVILPLSILSTDNNFSMLQLTKVGSNLTSLILIYTNNVTLDLIGLACPNLRVFCLDEVTYGRLERCHDQILFSKLQTLNITSVRGISPIPIPHLLFLLKNCFELEQLTFGYHNEINDDVMITLLNEINPLENLIEISLDCPRISLVAIMELLLINDLQYLEIKHAIPANEKNIIESCIKENNCWIICNFMKN